MNARLIRTVAALAIVGSIAASCGDDASEPSAESSAAVTTAVVDTTEAAASTTTEVAVTTTEAAAPTDAPTPTAAPTTTEAPATWAAAGSMPGLAYLPCCASNYSGDPSPAIPADPAAALAPGIYKAFRGQPSPLEPFDPTTITFSLAPFVACGEPDIFCEDGYVPGDVGVGPVAREVTMPLDDQIQVVLGGWACGADGLSYEVDHQAGDGALLAQLQTEYEAAYQRTVAPLVAADTPYGDYETTFATPQDGFSVPCQAAGVLQWQGSAGPAILLQLLGSYDDAQGKVVVATSISVETIYLTALEVGADGTQTLYFYAGFLS